MNEVLSSLITKLLGRSVVVIGGLPSLNYTALLLVYTITLLLFYPYRFYTTKAKRVSITISLLLMISGGYPNVLAFISGTVSVLLMLQSNCRHSRKKQTLIIIIIIIILLCISLYLYFANLQFRLQVNMDLGIGSRKTHFTLLPLPPKTVYLYRFSLTGIRYMTNTKNEGIIEFYSKICDTDSFTYLEEDEMLTLVFYYQQTSFKVEIFEVDYWKRGIFNVDYIN